MCVHSGWEVIYDGSYVFRSLINLTINVSSKKIRNKVDCFSTCLLKLESDTQKVKKNT